jgi:hypothetical protein
MKKCRFRKGLELLGGWAYNATVADSAVYNYTWNGMYQVFRRTGDDKLAR